MSSVTCTMYGIKHRDCTFWLREIPMQSTLRTLASHLGMAAPVTAGLPGTWYLQPSALHTMPPAFCLLPPR